MSKISYAQRIFAILNLLREQTDENHRMDAKEIARELELRQGLEIDPRSVRRVNLNTCKRPFSMGQDLCRRSELS